MRNEIDLSKFDQETLTIYQVSKWAARVLFLGGVTAIGIEAALGNTTGVEAGLGAVATSIAAYGASKASEELLPPSHP